MTQLYLITGRTIDGSQYILANRGTDDRPVFVGTIEDLYPEMLQRSGLASALYTLDEVEVIRAQIEAANAIRPVENCIGYVSHWAFNQTHIDEAAYNEQQLAEEGEF